MLNPARENDGLRQRLKQASDAYDKAQRMARTALVMAVIALCLVVGTMAALIDFFGR